MVWAAEEPVLLKPLGEAAVFWVLSPEAVSELAEGEYTVSLTLDTRRSAADWSWSGLCRSERVSLTVAAEPASLETKQEAFKGLVRARYHQLRDQLDTALSILDEWLARDPEDSAALGEKAALLEQSGRLPEALAAYGSAIDAFQKRFPGAMHPPRELMRNHSRLLNALIQLPQ
jgi:tetratricopeptide (TPR) repeat protein